MKNQWHISGFPLNDRQVCGEIGLDLSAQCTEPSHHLTLGYQRLSAWITRYLQTNPREDLMLEVLDTIKLNPTLV